MHKSDCTAPLRYAKALVERQQHYMRLLQSVAAGDGGTGQTLSFDLQWLSSTCMKTPGTAAPSSGRMRVAHGPRALPVATTTCKNYDK